MGLISLTRARRIHRSVAELRGIEIVLALGVRVPDLVLGAAAPPAPAPAPSPGCAAGAVAPPAPATA